MQISKSEIRLVLGLPAQELQTARSKAKSGALAGQLAQFAHCRGRSQSQAPTFPDGSLPRLQTPASLLPQTYRPGLPTEKEQNQECCMEATPPARVSAQEDGLVAPKASRGQVWGPGKRFSMTHGPRYSYRRGLLSPP